MWKLKEFERSMYKIIEVIDENENVIKTFVANELTYDEKKKKAQLMAAAPELLEVAEKAEEYIENGIEFGYIVPDQESKTPELLRKAINKAKGDDE